ncbi:MAG: HAD family phosphatase [Dactylosporangium sp.]|nr:HAD family phosphatase [Dactylosporangium sp.]NNJ61691.1 HAD family phosphatase [Dactylosporangium sp.]
MITMRLSTIFASVGAVLLDFDGPVCTTFAGYPSPQITDQMRRTLANTYPDALDRCRHRYPLHALAELGDLPQQVHDDLERIIQRGELRAAESATATPGAAGFLSACRAARLPVVIVTNNYEAAVVRYLARTRLTEYVAAVVARDTTDSALMKPHPHLVQRAMEQVAVAAEKCVLVGDSDTDIQAAVDAGTLSIGYANKPGKAEQFTALGANSIVTDMSELTAAVQQAQDAVRPS